jgi:nucleotide-binding universal stress UspA family protein
MKVLLAIDSSECSRAAVASVSKRPWTDDTHVLVITVVEPALPEYASWHQGSAAVLNEVQKELLEKSRNLVNERVEELKKHLPKVKIEGEVKEGKIRDVIVDTAESWKADFIVMGSHGRTGFRKFLLGSVAEGVVSRASCSVEIIKAPAEDE